MGYQLESEEVLADGIKRIAEEQVDKALKYLTEKTEESTEAVHEARKCFKKVRGTLRLVRDEIGEDIYKTENVCYRDAGRRLSELRDSYVVVETLQGLTDYFENQLASDAFAKAHQALSETHESLKSRMLDQEEVLAEVAEAVRAAKVRIPDWPIEHNDFSALEPGLRRVYKRGRNRLADAYANPAPEKFHEWRKRVKYLWYNLCILKPAWPVLISEWVDETHNLSNYLGDAHDFVKLREVIEQQPDILEDEREYQALIALIDQREAALEAAARPLGERIYVEKPKIFIKRMRAYWQVWQTHGRC